MNTNECTRCLLQKIARFTSELASTKYFSSLIYGNRHSCIQVPTSTFLNLPTLYEINDRTPIEASDLSGSFNFTRENDCFFVRFSTELDRLNANEMTLKPKLD